MSRKMNNQIVVSSNHSKTLSSKYRIHRCLVDKVCSRRFRKISIVICFAWLLMNNDPANSLRTVREMAASRLLNRSLFGPFAGRYEDGSGSRNQNGLSTIEAIALIQAINGNNRNNQQPDVGSVLKQERSRSSLTRQAVTQQTSEIQTRQIPPPPVIVQPVIVQSIVAAAVAAFFAAVAQGQPPFVAFAAAVAAASAAFLLVLIERILVVNKDKNQKAAPLIKKLVIKKTVLPFFIPIPIKKQEKKIIYKYEKKPEYHKKEEHHEEYDHDEHESKVNFKYRKSLNSPPKKSVTKDSTLNKIESLLSEQDRIQAILNKLEERDLKPTRSKSIKRATRTISNSAIDLDSL